MAKRAVDERGLWVGGMVQAASNLVFAWQAMLGANYWA